MIPSNLSRETMNEVVLHAVALQGLEGPPSAFRALLLTCRHFHSILALDATPSLYRGLFQAKFDVDAPMRRLPPQDMLPAHLASELKRRFTALKVIRAGDFDHPGIPEALFVAHVMLLENDGKNAAQLRWARLDAFLDAYLATCLHSTTDEARGWPLGCEVNSLAIALLAQWTTHDDLKAELQDRRAQVMSLLAPFALAGFRYTFHSPNPTSAAPMIGWDEIHPTTKGAVRQLAHFGQTVLLQLPSIALWSCLSYLARVEMYPLVVLPHLPRTRAERTGPQTSAEDIEEYNDACRSRSPLPRSSSLAAMEESSRMHDAEWARTCISSGEPSPGLTPPPLAPYTLGSLTGEWQGTLVMPMPEEYAALQSGSSKWGPGSLELLARQPLFCSLQEHYRRKGGPQSSARVDAWDSIANVPSLSSRIHWTHEKAGVSIHDVKMSHKVFYTTFDPHSSHHAASKSTESGAQDPGPSEDKLDDIVEIIVSGKTETHHGVAWGAFTFRGTVRPSDGMVVLLREPAGTNATSRAWFVGYITSERTLVGKWKLCESGSHCEGIWSMCKKPATH